MTDHPRDEFDRVPETSARQGVHRGRFIPEQSSGLGLKMAAGSLALLVGLGAFFLPHRLGFPVGSDRAAAPSTSSAPEASTTEDGAATAEPSDAASTGAPDEPGGESTDDPTGSDRMDAVDRSQTVNVLNGTGSPGLASVAAGRLASAGWTSALPGNWAGVPVDASVVFYDGEEQRAAAEAVAEDLGITELAESAAISPAISVVLGPEFR
ncbi:LytR C-terminal domain-containing protein [Arthrobacter sp. TMS1-12-1]